MPETHYFPLLGTVVALTEDWALQVYDDELGLWLTLAQADEEAEMVRAGIPVLRGPYVVDYMDIPTDGSTKTLWTPQTGDVLLRLFPDVDPDHLVQWDVGALVIGQGMTFADGLFLPYWSSASAGAIGLNQGTNVDTDDALFGGSVDATNTDVYVASRVMHTTDPVQVGFRNPGDDPAPGAGHLELYALVSKAIAP